MGLGPYPVISIEYARKQVHQNQILLYEGEDPLALKQKSAQDKQQRLSHVFSDAARVEYNKRVKYKLHFILTTVIDRTYPHKRSLQITTNGCLRRQSSNRATQRSLSG